LTGDRDPNFTKIAALRPGNNTFPVEVFLELAAEAIGESGATQVEPFSYEGIRERYLPEYEFHGKSQQHEPLRVDCRRHDQGRDLPRPAR
jgi:hypothetical protein